MSEANHEPNVELDLTPEPISIEISQEAILEDLAIEIGRMVINNCITDLKNKTLVLHVNALRTQNHALTVRLGDEVNAREILANQLRERPTPPRRSQPKKPTPRKRTTRAK